MNFATHVTYGLLYAWYQEIFRHFKGIRTGDVKTFAYCNASDYSKTKQYEIMPGICLHQSGKILLPKL